MKTARGIYTNIKESTYNCEIYGLFFYFSSKKYLEKFKERYPQYLSEEVKKIEYKYKIEMNYDIFLLVSLYKKIEKRGFYIKNMMNNKEIKSLDFTFNYGD